MLIPTRVAERAASNWVLDPGTGCYLSTYSTASHGYAQVGWRKGDKGFGTTAHRAAQVFYTGKQIADDMTVDHFDCHNRLCVREEHLRTISNFENARRNRADALFEIGKCLNGHDDNPVVRHREGKETVTCLDCERDRQRRYRSRRAA